MSSVDDLFAEIQEDLAKANEEEEQIQSIHQLKRSAEQESGAVKKARQDSADAASKPQTHVREVIVTSSAPVVNKEYLDSSLGKKPQPSGATNSVRPSVKRTATFVPAQLTRPPPVPPAPVPPRKPPQEALVFATQQRASTQLSNSGTTTSSNATDTSSRGDAKSVVPGASNSTQGYGLFVGNLGPEVRDDHLTKQFCEYPSLIRVKAVMENPEKCIGYGFVYFSDPFEMLRALREKNGKLCGPRPMIVKKAKGPRET